MGTSGSLLTPTKNTGGSAGGFTLSKGTVVIEASEYLEEAVGRLRDEITSETKGFHEDSLKEKRSTEMRTIEKYSVTKRCFSREGDPKNSQASHTLRGFVLSSRWCVREITQVVFDSCAFCVATHFTLGEAVQHAGIFNLDAWPDTDWVGCIFSRRSPTGFFVSLQRTNHPPADRRYQPSRVQKHNFPLQGLS